MACIWKDGHCLTHTGAPLLHVNVPSIYAKPCPCGGILEYLGEDRDGRDVWHCQTCDRQESE